MKGYKEKQQRKRIKGRKGKKLLLDWDSKRNLATEAGNLIWDRM